MVKPTLPFWAVFMLLPRCTWAAPEGFCVSCRACRSLAHCFCTVHVHGFMFDLLPILPADFLYSPMNGTEQKRKMVENLAKEARLKKRTVNFVNLLIDKHRVDAIEDVFAAFEEEYCTLTDTQVGSGAWHVPGPGRWLRLAVARHGDWVLRARLEIF